MLRPSFSDVFRNYRIVNSESRWVKLVSLDMNNSNRRGHYHFKHQFHKMVKHTQTIRRQFADELLECVFGHFVGLAHKGLN